MVIFDPLLNFTGRGTDTYKTSEVRPILSQLAAMAERTNCAIVAIMHLNKRSTEGNPLYRITASGDFTAAARSVLVVGKFPDDPKRRYLAPVKTNLSAPPDTLSYHFSDDGVFAWEPGTVDVDVSSMLSNNSKEDVEGALAEAMDFLEDVLTPDGMESKVVIKEAGEVGISDITLRRAKKLMRVEAKRVTTGNRGKGLWKWLLPSVSQDDHCPGERKDDHLTNNEQDNTPPTPTPRDAHKMLIDEITNGAKNENEHLMGTRLHRDEEAVKDPEFRKVINPTHTGGSEHLTKDEAGRVSP